MLNLSKKISDIFLKGESKNMIGEMYMDKPNKKCRLKKAVIAGGCYFISLIPLFLPWLYFEAAADGVKNGADIINKVVLCSLCALTFLSIFLAVKFNYFKIAAIILLALHPFIYLYYFLFWYVPLITDFDLRISFDSAHYGFYLSFVLSVLLFLFYAKYEKLIKKLLVLFK